MSDLRNLFIASKNGLFMGRSQSHRKLAELLKIKTGYIIYGGGVFDQRTRKEENIWILFGESFDFGKYDRGQIEYFIKSGKVFWLRRKLGEKINFVFDDIRKETLEDLF